MHSEQTCFTAFTSPVDDLSLPVRFTFPFYYKPHPLSIAAAGQLQQYLRTQIQWQHDFEHSGKMFGVLVVKNADGQLGFLSAFSGKLAQRSRWPHFVPPVFDILEDENFYRNELDQITELSKKIKAGHEDPNLVTYRQQLSQLESQQQLELTQCRDIMSANKQARKAQRAAAGDNELLSAQLAKQSVADKNTLRDLKLSWDKRVLLVSNKLDQLTQLLDSLDIERKALSSKLQHKLFAQYRFLNLAGGEKDLNDIFEPLAMKVPPAGAGECAAPKLLQYAFAHQLTPITMAEFWWGASPKSEIRKHQQFYPSCTSKCQPILGHMLGGMLLDENPLLEQPQQDKPIEVLYEDDAIAVINKPHNLLSVPGKTIKDSVLSRMKERYPDATGPLIVHRLDMATSGIMLIALTQRANKSLTKQFRMRSIKKQYVALVDGNVLEDAGEIDLPMRGDLYDRPRQLVCTEHGKPAFTTWQVLERIDNKTKLLLSPTTGRTHQLRVHCAFHQGLNMPIVGDTLYGEEANRLHLHAQSIVFTHPYNHQMMEFKVLADF